MKLNADIGELTGNDSALVPYLDKANISCGFHASLPRHIRETVKLTHAHGVSIGAHPSYPDRDNFGRVSMDLTSDEIYDLIFGQVHLLMRIAAGEGAKVDYIKPHGALYHDMMGNVEIYSAIVRIAAYFHLDLMIPARPNIKKHLKVALVREVSVIREAFADRSYTKKGLLTPRSQENSLFIEPSEIITQATNLISSGRTPCETGKMIKIQADSLCLHGDNPASVEAARAINQLLHP